MPKGKLTASELRVLHALVEKHGAKAVVAAIDDGHRKPPGRPAIERGDEMTGMWVAVEILRRRPGPRQSVENAAGEIAKQRTQIVGRRGPAGAIVAVRDEKNRIYRLYYASNKRAKHDPDYRQWRETMIENIGLIQKNFVH